MINSLLASGQISISGSFDFNWWREKKHKPARVMVPVNLHILEKHHIVVFRQQGLDWAIAECLKDFCDIYPVEPEKLIVLSCNCIPENWDVHYFSCNQKGFSHIAYKSLSTTKAYELCGGNLISTDYFAFNKKDDPKESPTFKTH